MIKYLYRHNKDYSRFNIIKALTKEIESKENIYILLPFSKNQFIYWFFKRDKIINDFFISNYDTYVYDRKKITKKNPRAWWKYLQDWINFRYSKYLLSDTLEHFNYWQRLFGAFKGKHFVLPVLADKTMYYPTEEVRNDEKIKILFYGSFIPLHGIDIVLDAFKILEDKNIKYEASIIGNGQVFQRMHEKFNQLNLKNVKMDGKFIHESDLANKVRQSDIILGIFGQSVKAQSVVPNKVYQALASKKVSITMKSKAIDEFFTSDEIITCEPDDLALSNSIINLIEDKNLMDNIAQNGYDKFCKLYDKTAEDFKKFILSVK